MLEELPYLSLFPFFTLSAECLYFGKKRKWGEEYLLPSTQEYLNEEKLADFFLAWQEEALFFRIEVKKPFEKINATEYRNGDSVELFIDTRDLKSKNSFCHHFLFFPEKVGGYFGKEITHFRSSDLHPLADPKDLEVKSELFSSSYLLEIQIPISCLYGFDPSRFDRFGFSYRINHGAFSQNFSLSSFEFSVEQQPSFWCSMKMVKEKT